MAGTDDSSALYSANNNESTVSDGSFTYPVTFTPTTGSYIVCAWLETDSDDHSGKGDVASEVVTASAKSNYTAINTDTLGIALSAPSPASGIPFTITFNGTDTPYNTQGMTPDLYALVRRENGVPCQPTFGQDEQVAGTDDSSALYSANNNESTVSDGSFTYPVTFTPTTGSYIVCAWLETDSDDHSGKGDVASEVVTAAASASYLTASIGPPPVHPPSISSPSPKPACVVPRYAGATLKSAEARLKANHCRVGILRHARDPHVRKGHVIKLSAKPGRHYAYGTKVSITVSTG